MGEVSNIESATEIAKEYLRKVSAGELVLDTSATLEHDFGWIFFHIPRDPDILVGGNAPFIVDRGNGSIHVTGTAHPIDYYLENYAAKLSKPSHPCR